MAAGGALAGGGGLFTGTGAVPRGLGGGADTCEPPLTPPMAASAAAVGLPRLMPSSARDAPASPPSSSTQTSQAFCQGSPVLLMTSPSLSLHPAAALVSKRAVGGAVGLCGRAGGVGSNTGAAGHAHAARAAARERVCAAARIGTLSWSARRTCRPSAG